MEFRFPKDDVITLGISMFKLVGEFIPHRSLFPINIYRIFNGALILLNTILLLVNLPKADAYMYVQIIGSSVLFGHGLLRYICFVYYKSEFYGLLHDIPRFWNIKQVKNIHKMADKKYVSLMKAPKMLIALAIVAIITYCFKPLTAKGALMFPARVLVDFVGFQAILLFSQYYGLLIITAIVAGYDIIYISYSAHVITQMRMLKYKFEHITGDISIETIYSYIRHHQFMLQIFERMKGIYFWMFFFLYGLTLLSGCSQLYVLMLGHTNVSDFLMSVVYITALLIEFGLYTSIVEEVVTQFRDITLSVYRSPWYERTLEDRKVLLIIMMKGQHQGYFSAGGLSEINLNTFGSVIRKIFSFYAILKNVLDN